MENSEMLAQLIREYKEIVYPKIMGILDAAILAGAQNKDDSYILHNIKDAITSLHNYETRLIFPAWQHSMNTGKIPELKQWEEICGLVKRKENYIAGQAEMLQKETGAMQGGEKILWQDVIIEALPLYSRAKDEIYKCAAVALQPALRY